MFKPIRIALAGSAWLLASCTSPFTERLSRMDWSGEPVPGTIAVSQPKLYRREALINERRDEVQWIKQELESSKTATFEPELVRETEQIRQMAIALGLSFDPAGAVNYRRDAQTGEIQQQIEVLRLEVMLDQLRRDVNLMRGGFAEQFTLVNADLGKLDSTVKAATSPAQAASLTKLNEAIDAMKAAVATRLDTEGKPAAKANASANPGDRFRDRSALRDMLKSALNAATTDDSHDYAGSALIRLNFQAMVLPDRVRTRAPGVVQMKVVKPALSAEDRERLYRSWLDHLNQQLNRASGAGWLPDTDIVFSKAADNFDLVSYRYSRTPVSAKAAAVAPAAPAAKGKAKPKVPAPIPAPAPACTALLEAGVVAGSEDCGSLVFAVPKFLGRSPQEGAYSTLISYLAHGAEDDAAAADTAFTNTRKRISSYATQVVTNCGLPTAAPQAKGVPLDDRQELVEAIRMAQMRAVGGDALARIERQAQRMLRRNGTAPAASTGESGAIALRTARAHQLLSTFEAVAYAACSSEQRAAFRRSGPVIYTPVDFSAAIDTPPRVAVYEIGPREQMQQVSTVSRVANNLSMALALSGSVPRSGFGANAAAGYSQQAMGRAAALERVPGLVGYSTAGGTFGWVIAPKAVLDPKGTVQLEQTARALDLTVELSVPGWWPWFTIEAVTSWGAASGTITAGTVNVGKKIKHVVPMAANAADFDELTAKLLRSDAAVVRSAILDDASLARQFVAACRASSLYLRGPNIWRATSVVIGGHALGESAITVAPDMSGILVAVPALDKLVADTPRSKVGLAVFTRYGDARGEVDYVARPVPDGCAEPAKPADANKTVATSISPIEFKAGSEQHFTIQGSKLDKIDGVAINGQPGTIDGVDKDGKWLKVIFTAAQTSSLPVSRTIPVSFYAGQEELGKLTVENRP